MKAKKEDKENTDFQNFEDTNTKINAMIHDLLEHLYQLDQDKLNILDKLSKHSLEEVKLTLKKEIFDHPEEEVVYEDMVTLFNRHLAYIYRNFYRYIEIDQFKAELTKKSNI